MSRVYAQNGKKTLCTTRKFEENGEKRLEQRKVCVVGKCPTFGENKKQGGGYRIRNPY